MRPRDLAGRLLLVLTVLLAASAHAEDPAGHWFGQMASGFKVRIDVARSAEGYAASLTNPNGATTQLDQFASDGQTLQFGIRKLGLSYSGRWREQEQRWEGTLNFQGQHPMDLRRAHADELRPPDRKRPQETAIQAGALPYSVRDVVFNNPADRLQLAGTLTMPQGAGRFPAVVLVSGTGPNARDEDIGTHKWFLVLADALSRRGIAVLRYDKRGVGGSTGRYGGATTADFASDARAAFDYVRTVTEVDPARIGLLGHSEGGIIAPMVAAAAPEVAFIGLLASPAMRGDRLFAAQAATVARLQGVPAEYIERRRAFDRALYEAVIDAPSGAEARLRASHIVQQGVADKIVDTADADQLPASISAPWQRYFLAHDPAPVLSMLRLPVLVVNGGRDAQVPPENTALFRDALQHNPQARIVELAGKNHLLQSAGTGAPTEYEDIDETISPEALALVMEWVERACTPASRVR